MNVFEWLNSAYYGTSVSTAEMELAKDAWYTSRSITFEEIAAALEDRSVNKPPEVREAFSYAASLVRSLGSANSKGQV